MIAACRNRSRLRTANRCSISAREMPITNVPMLPTGTSTR